MALVTLAVLFASFVLIFLAKLQKTKVEREFGRPTSCPTGVTRDDVVQDELAKKTGIVPYKALVECFCKAALATESFRAMTHERFVVGKQQHAFYCKTWATSFVATQLLSLLAVITVVVVNVLLARILDVLVAMEKHHTESSMVVSRVVKVFLAQFCNTALLLVVINANLDYFVDATGSATARAFRALPVLAGKYSDFTPAWYNDVGVSLMLTMIINTFSPHVYAVLHYGALETRRFVDRGWSFDYAITRQDTQRDLDAFYRGPKFDLAARYAQTLTSIFIIYLVRVLYPLDWLTQVGSSAAHSGLVVAPVLGRDATAPPRRLLCNAHDVLGRQIQYAASSSDANAVMRRCMCRWLTVRPRVALRVQRFSASRGRRHCTTAKSRLPLARCCHTQCSSTRS